MIIIEICFEVCWFFFNKNKWIKGYEGILKCDNCLLRNLFLLKFLGVLVFVFVGEDFRNFYFILIIKSWVDWKMNNLFRVYKRGEDIR